MEYKAVALPAAMVGVVVGMLVGILQALPSIVAVIVPSVGEFSRPMRFILSVCCLWIIGGGAAAAYLFRKKVGEPDYKIGAAAGGIFGAVYAIVVNGLGFLIGLLLNMISSKVVSTVEPGLFGLTGLSSTAASFFAAVTSLTLSVFFGALGGVLYVAYSRK
ncbi:MAG: hypothetical protein V1875_02010 [Candidatus Altiarchaeota archaeon]